MIIFFLKGSVREDNIRCIYKDFLLELIKIKIYMISDIKNKLKFISYVLNAI